MSDRKRAYSFKEGLAMMAAKTVGIDPYLAADAGEDARSVLAALRRAKDAKGPVKAKHIAAAQSELRKLSPKQHGKLINALQAKVLALQGRGGDTAVAHLEPGEMVIPRAVLTPQLAQLIAAEAAKRGIDPKQLIVGSRKASINPATGAEEFGWFRNEQDGDGLISDLLYRGEPVVKVNLPASIEDQKNIRSIPLSLENEVKIDPITVTATRREERLDPDEGTDRYDKAYFPVQSGQFRESDDYGNDAFNASRRGGASTASNQQRGHYARDVRANPGEDVVATADGTVTKVGFVYGNDPNIHDEVKRAAKAGLRYVEITSPNGKLYRTHYVDPNVKVGDKVTGGQTQIGRVQDLAPVYPVDDRHPGGMINHVHVEIADPTVRAYEKPKPTSSDYTTYLRLDPTYRMRVPTKWQAP